jgi:hypothetical protein
MNDPTLLSNALPIICNLFHLFHQIMNNEKPFKDYGLVTCISDYLWIDNCDANTS